MAIAEALALIDQNWDDFETLIPVRVLAAIAKLRDVRTSSEDDVGEVILDELLPAIPADHPIWAALRHSATRFDPGHQPPPEARLASRCIDHAIEAMTNPDIADHAVADHLQDMALDTIRRHGVVPTTDLPDDLPVSEFRLVEQGNVPQFIFASMTPPTLHEVVLRLHDQLDGHRDPIGAMSWWLTPNPWLSATPAELLGSGRDAEITYAAAQLANDSW